MKSNGESLQYVYFEHQSPLSNQCGKCTLNNILGQPFYTKENLDQICYSLSKDFVNPHKHIFGGDYDTNVLMIALQNLGYQCKWLDSRAVDQICQQSLAKNQRRIGYIVNRKCKKKGLLELIGLSGRHWLAVRYVNNRYYLLDSKSDKKSPQIILSIDIFLRQEISNQSQVFQVLIEESKQEKE